MKTALLLYRAISISRLIILEVIDSTDNICIAYGNTPWYGTYRRQKTSTLPDQHTR